MNKIFLRDNQTLQILAEGGPEDMEKIFQAALYYEKNGIETHIQGPTITESLANSLGIKGRDKIEFQESVTQELEDHEGLNCCGEQDEGT